MRSRRERVHKTGGHGGVQRQRTAPTETKKHLAHAKYDTSFPTVCQHPSIRLVSRPVRGFEQAGRTVIWSTKEVPSDSQISSPAMSTKKKEASLTTGLRTKISSKKFALILHRMNKEGSLTLLCFFLLDLLDGGSLPGESEVFLLVLSDIGAWLEESLHLDDGALLQEFQLWTAHLR